MLKISQTIRQLWAQPPNDAKQDRTISISIAFLFDSERSLDRAQESIIQCVFSMTVLWVDLLYLIIWSFHWIGIQWAKLDQQTLLRSTTLCSANYAFIIHSWKNWKHVCVLRESLSSHSTRSWCWSVRAPEQQVLSVKRHSKRCLRQVPLGFSSVRWFLQKCRLSPKTNKAGGTIGLDKYPNIQCSSRCFFLHYVTENYYWMDTPPTAINSSSNTLTQRVAHLNSWKLELKLEKMISIEIKFQVLHTWILARLGAPLLYMVQNGSLRSSCTQRWRL